MYRVATLWALLVLASLAQAQFQFFEHMFGGGHQQQQHHRPQEGQNVPSDSSWFRNNWEAGEWPSNMFRAVLCTK